MITPVPSDAATTIRFEQRSRIVDQVLSDLSSNDVDHCVRAFSADLHMTVPWQPPGLTRECHGRDELGTLLTWVGKTFEDFDIRAVKSWEMPPDGLLTEYHLNTTHRFNRKPYINTYIGLFFFSDDDLITEWVEYCNPINTLFALSR